MNLLKHYYQQFIVKKINDIYDNADDKLKDIIIRKMTKRGNWLYQRLSGRVIRNRIRKNVWNVNNFIEDFFARIWKMELHHIWKFNEALIN